jgi:hypothetical protein
MLLHTSIDAFDRQSRKQMMFFVTWFDASHSDIHPHHALSM